MLIDDLPRLTDEERVALDVGYIAMAGVTAGNFSLDDLIGQRMRRQATSAACPDCHGSGLDPSEGTLCERCEGSGNRPN